MAIYFGQDLKTGVKGDLVVNDRGDLDLAESHESVVQLLKMVIATDLGEFRANTQFGANLGSLVGTPPEVALERIPILIREGIRRGGFIDQGDVYIDAYPIDIDKIIVFADLKGSFIDSEEREITNPSETLKFYFPYTAERIREWT